MDNGHNMGLSQQDTDALACFQKDPVSYNIISEVFATVKEITIKEMVAKYGTEQFCFICSFNSESSGLLIIANKMKLSVQLMLFG